MDVAWKPFYAPKHLAMALTRAQLESLTATLVERTAGPRRQALEDAGRGGDADHPAQYDDSDVQEPDVLDGG